jgi:hypothetical protein
VARVKHCVAAGMLTLTLLVAGCGGAGAGASGCTAGGMDAVTTRSNLERRMEDAQRDGRITTARLTAARDRLDTETQAAEDDGDWEAYCTAVDDTAAELGL